MGENQNKRKINFSWVQACWIVIAINLLCGAIFAFVSHDMDLVALAEPLGFVMLLAGIINIFVCFCKSRIIHGSRWLIADGLTAILLSLFPLFNQMILPVMIPLFFGAWELFSGILKVLDSTELKTEKIECWIGFAFIGFVELLSGTLSMVKPIDDLVGINTVIATIFLVQSCGFFLKATMYKYLIK